MGVVAPGGGGEEEEEEEEEEEDMKRTAENIWIKERNNNCVDKIGQEESGSVAS